MTNNANLQQIILAKAVKLKNMNSKTIKNSKLNNMDYNSASTEHKLVEKLMTDGKCPIGNYILLANGDMLNFEHYFIEDTFHFRILNKSTIDSYFEFNEEDDVSDFDGACVFGNDEFAVFVGEGSYGSEGALWVTENKTDKLLWFLFSDTSNPFVSAYINENNEVVAKTNLDKIWKIPLFPAARAKFCKTKKYEQ